MGSELLAIFARTTRLLFSETLWLSTDTVLVRDRSAGGDLDFVFDLSLFLEASRVGFFEGVLGFFGGVLDLDLLGGVAVLDRLFFLSSSLEVFDFFFFSRLLPFFSRLRPL